MKSPLLIMFAVLLALVAAVAVVFSRPLQIAYHRRALERLHKDIYAEPSVTSDGLVGYGGGDQFERQAKHCDRLAQLGYFFHKRYDMENLPDTDEVNTAFWRLVQKTFPDRRYPTLSYPDNVLEVWDLAEYEPMWDAFVAEHNVPDFADRYMTQTEDAEHQKTDILQRPTTQAKSVTECIASWAHMGMWLPDGQQINIFRAQFESARGPLRDALSHSDDSVRQRAAYVIGELGRQARPAGEDLLERFLQEPQVTVRLYLVDALNSIGYNTAATVDALSKRYDVLDGSNVAPTLDLFSSEVDENTTIAAALYTMVDDQSKLKYYEFVTKWLDPPPAGVDGELLEGYWERRWIAVNVLERMPGARDAIPKLESLQAEVNAKPWVNVHVPRVLTALRHSAR